jgi:formylglycine-generating enzyme required for sulfatase activity
MNAAHAGHPDYKFACGDTVRTGKKGMMMYNFNSIKYFKFKNRNDSSFANENADILAPCKSYWANDFGLYNMSGNAAEMIATKGIAKGGSFRDGEASLRINNYISYDKSACNIGFRYFMEVIKPEIGTDYPINDKILR